MCLDAQQQGWLCGLLEDAAEQGGVEALAEVPTARLVVVDYAETRAEQLAALLPALAGGASAEHPVRVLLLVRSGARDGDWRALLRGRGDWLNAQLESTDPQVLDKEPLTPDQRAVLFTATAAAFARREQPNPTRAPTVPVPTLDGPTFATPLMVVVAAYLTVHESPKLPTTRQALLDALAEHEDRYWRLASEKAALGLDEDLRARIVALATLAGAGSEGEAAGVLALLPDMEGAKPERCRLLARWVRDLYPGPRWWNPVEPDLLGEYLVATHLTAYPSVLAGVLDRDQPAAVTQPLGLYARAAGEHSDLAAALQPVLTNALPGLTHAATTQAATYTNLSQLDATTIATALQRAINVIPVALAALTQVLNASPKRADLVLSPLILTMTDQLVTTYRRLTQTGHATYEPSLAASLNNLSSCLSDLGRYDDALTAAGDAVTIYWRLAKANSTIHEPHLATALDNLSSYLGKCDRHNEALSAASDAVKTYRRLARANPTTHGPGLAMALTHLSNHLSNLGHHKKALTAAKQAVTIYRRLTKAKATATSHEPNLAMSLNILSDRLNNLGHHDKALTAVEQAVTIYRRLATDNAATYEPDLASSLNNLSIYLSDLERHDEALSAADEAVNTYRRLARANPTAHEPHLTTALSNFSRYLGQAGYHDEAQHAREEAVELRGRR